MLAPAAYDDAGDPYQAVEYQWTSSSGNWFSVAPAGGCPLTLLPPVMSGVPVWAPSCSTCVALDFSALFLQGPIGDGGVTGTWNGMNYGAGACTACGGSTIACADVQCEPAGSYVVTMCASGFSEKCVTVPFDFPGTTDVTGTIAP